jgi:hypothetical protein
MEEEFLDLDPVVGLVVFVKSILVNSQNIYEKLDFL